MKLHYWLLFGLWTLLSFSACAEKEKVSFRHLKPDSFKNGLLALQVPDGCYRVDMIIGSAKDSGQTTVRAESRRLFVENLFTAKGEYKKYSFTIHKRNTRISDTESVKIKSREKTKLNWDDSLTLEIVGEKALCKRIDIYKVEDVPVVYLCGNSTVVDQDNEPWASWGQMIPRFFDERICFANFAESGEAANSFIAARRLKKILTEIKPGDYLMVEFGHNDQKQKGEGKGAYLSFWNSLEQFVDSARAHGATPVLITPTQRRRFDEYGKIQDTHEDYPQAMRDLAKAKKVPLIDLNEMTRTLYEAWGEEASKRAFVHYPANTFPDQPKALADNTHFNPYGAYEIAKCVIEGMKALQLPLIEYLRSDYKPFDPASPDAFESFVWLPSRQVEILKPDGN